MTKERYPNTPRVSRSRSPAPARRPFGRYFESLQPESEPHPIDLIVDSAPEVVALRPGMKRVTNVALQNSRDHRVFITYDDRRGNVAAVRESLYFDAGFECGSEQGRAVSSVASASGNRLTRLAVRQIRIVLLRSRMPLPIAAALLLEMARGLVLGLPVPPGRRRRGRAAGAGK